MNKSYCDDKLSSPSRKTKIIVLEGGDYTGKTTLAYNLLYYMEKHNLKGVYTREPGGCDLSEKIRELIMSNEMSARTEAYLFAASRINWLENNIIPTLHENKLDYIIVDRYKYSSYVYQGIVGGLGLDFVKSLHKGFISPDKIIVLSGEIEQLLRRDREEDEENRFDTKGTEYHKKVSKAYKNKSIYDDVLADDILFIDNVENKEQKEVLEQTINFLNI